MRREYPNIFTALPAPPLVAEEPTQETFYQVFLSVARFRGQSNDPAREVDQRETREMLVRALGLLPERQRTILILREVEGRGANGG